MDYAEQKSYGKKINLMLKKEVGTSFGVKYQGDPKGKVAEMIIVASNVNFVGKIKTHLWNRFKISGSKMNGHGGGLDTTIRIKLSEISADCFTKIDADYTLFLQNKEKKSNSKLVPKVLKNEIEKVESAVNEIKPKHELHQADNSIKSCRISLTSFLYSMYSFEKRYSLLYENYKNFFSYEDATDPEMQVIDCADESVAKQIEMAARFLIGDVKSTNRTGKEVMIDFSMMLSRGKRSTNGTYSLPPNENSTAEEVSARLCRVNYWAKPVVTPNNGNFLVSYPRLARSQKILEQLVSMGWKVKAGEGNTMHVIVNACAPKSTAELDSKEIIATPVVKEEPKEVKEIFVPIVKEEPKIELHHKEKLPSAAAKSSSDNAVKISDRVIPHFDIPVNEVFMELQEMYNDTELFSKLSHKTQNEILSVLRDHLKKNDLEAYARMLLDALK